MNKLPDSVSFYKKTPTFAEDSIPAGLRKAHQAKAGAWGKIVVIEGNLLYRILEPQRAEAHLSPTRFGVIEPQVLHEVQPIGAVRFYIEFYR